MSEYEVYWVTDFPLVNSWVYLQRFINFLFEAVCTSYKKQTNKYKEKSVILELIVIKS